MYVFSTVTTVISSAPFIKFKNFMVTRYLTTESSHIISSFMSVKSPFSETVLSVLMNVLHQCSVCVTRHVKTDECVIH